MPALCEPWRATWRPSSAQMSGRGAGRARALALRAHAMSRPDGSPFPDRRPKPRPTAGRREAHGRTAGRGRPTERPADHRPVRRDPAGSRTATPNRAFAQGSLPSVPRRSGLRTDSATPPTAPTGRSVPAGPAGHGGHRRHRPQPRYPTAGRSGRKRQGEAHRPRPYLKAGRPHRPCARATKSSDVCSSVHDTGRRRPPPAPA